MKLFDLHPGLVAALLAVAQPVHGGLIASDPRGDLGLGHASSTGEVFEELGDHAAQPNAPLHQMSMQPCIALAHLVLAPEYADMHKGARQPRSALEALMLDKGLTDNELARHLRARGNTTRQSTISRIRVGRTKNPDETTVRALAEYFDVSTEQMRSLDALRAGAEDRRHASGGKAAGLSDQALQLARLWMRLPTFKQTGYLQAITVDAAVAQVFPEMEGAMRAAMIATNPNYHKLTEDLVQSRKSIGQQMMLDLQGGGR